MGLMDDIIVGGFTYGDLIFKHHDQVPYLP
jgi:hypothetical protein